MVNFKCTYSNFFVKTSPVFLILFLIEVQWWYLGRDTGIFIKLHLHYFYDLTWSLFLFEVWSLLYDSVWLTVMTCTHQSVVPVSQFPFSSEVWQSINRLWLGNYNVAIFDEKFRAFHYALLSPHLGQHKSADGTSQTVKTQWKLGI